MLGLNEGRGAAGGRVPTRKTSRPRRDRAC